MPELLEKIFNSSNVRDRVLNFFNPEVGKKIQEIFCDKIKIAYRQILVPSFEH